MLASSPSRKRTVVSSLASSVLVVLVVGLGYLTFRTVTEHRQGGDGGTGGGGAAAPAGAEGVPEALPLVEFDSFSARHEKSSDSERLHVGLRLRVNAPSAMNCFVFVLARNDHTSPKLWAAWPPQGPGGAITAGGHLSSSNPAGGQPITLTTGWTRIAATLDHPIGKPPFESVMIYVVSPRGEILLARPFAL